MTEIPRLSVQDSESESSFKQEQSRNGTQNRILNMESRNQNPGIGIGFQDWQLSQAKKSEPGTSDQVSLQTSNGSMGKFKYIEITRSGVTCKKCFFLITGFLLTLFFINVFHFGQ